MEQNQEELAVARKFFTQHPLMTLVTVSDQGRPQTAAVYVYIDEDCNCYCVSRESTRKYNNIVAHKSATLTTYDEDQLLFAELLGEAEVVTDDEEITKVLPKLQEIVASRRAEYWVPPVTQITGDLYVLFKIVPHHLTFADYNRSVSAEAEPHVVHFDFRS